MKEILVAMKSWRTASVSLLSFSSGLPLGLVWIAIPDWMRSIGVDIRVVGLITLAQAPWTFKFLWSPFMDRFQIPKMGRHRGWAAVAQITLFALTLFLAGLGGHPDTPWVVGALAFAIAFASATQDIAIDAYAVDVLRPDEQGIAVGARTALYRGGMSVAGGLAITLAAWVSWPFINVCLAILFLPMIVITWKSPDPENQVLAPQTMKDAVWLPLVDLFRRPRALEILAFVFFYKLGDNLVGALIRPFLVDMGYNALDRGVALATAALGAGLVGTFVGGVCTTVMGLGHALWIFGLFQIFSNIGYAWVADSEVNRVLMYSAVAFENFSGGLGTGAFGVFLLRITEKRFSATQYALLSSLFSLPRVISGPIAGFAAAAIGWEAFFWLTLLTGVPGLLLLQLFSPIGVRDPQGSPQ